MPKLNVHIAASLARTGKEYCIQEEFIWLIRLPLKN